MILSPAPVWLAAMLLTLVLALRAAVPRGHRRPVRAKLLMRALLPWRILRSRSGRLDIAAFLFSALLAGMMLGWALVSGSWWADMLSARLTHGLGPVAPFALPRPAAVALMTLALFLAYEAAYWLNHWMSHRIGWLWEFHKVHHSAESLSLLTNFRVHPVDTIIFYNMAACMTGCTAGLIRYALGGAVDDISVGGTNLLVFVSSIVLSYLQHSHLWIATTGRWGRLILSPAHHQLHHSTDPGHHNRNLGATLALFDWAAGTLLLPSARRQRLRFGVEGLGYDPHGPKGAVLMPFADALRRVMPAFRPRRPSSPPMPRVADAPPAWAGDRA